MISLWIQLPFEILLVLGFLISLPLLMLFCLVALPGVLVFSVPARLGFGSVDLGRFGTLSFGSSQIEKAQSRAELEILWSVLKVLLPNPRRSGRRGMH